MTDAFICDAVRTPVGRYAGALSSIRTDDLAAIPLAALKARNPAIDWDALDDVIIGCANQAGEDNRNVARMASLLSGLGKAVPGSTSTASAAPASMRSAAPRARSRRVTAICSWRAVSRA